tara:strand:- start:23209 stop:25440 length:2232 start_codon:yes stop_codon:yes gene_type:complete
MKKLLLILCFIPLLTISQNQRKIALVIGNASYEDPNGVLKNPVNDSKLMSETFIGLEFDSVIVANDLSYDKMRKVFRDYRSSLKKFDVGFIYYSGHGMQDAYNETYLIPIDFPKNSTIDDVTDYGYSIQDILRSLDRYENKLNVFILDACRDNPYEKGWKGRSLKGEGLSEPQVPPTGSLVAYSTSPGDVASDNSDSDNSLYTKTLSEIMQQPNLKIEEVFKRVRNIVYSGSEQNQNPQWWGQLEGDLYLLLKKDYSKIEVKDLQLEAESAKEKGNIQNALDKYTILEIYLKSEMNNIDKKKLRKVYFDMGHIYYQMHEIEPDKYYQENKESWTESKYNEYLILRKKYLSHAANSFLNAKLLYENEGLISNNDKELYSEASYKYLRCQSYLDYASGGIDDSTFIQEINKLNTYNQENFGGLDFRTACSHYLTGLFIKDKNPLSSYKNFMKSADIFSANKSVRVEELNKYALTFDHVFPYKWSIISFNDILANAFNEDNYISEEKAKEVNEYLSENLNEYSDSIYIKNLDILNKGISISKSNNDSDLEGLYLTATRFFHTFPIVMDVSNEIYLECSHSTIRYRNLAMSHNPQLSYQDSISTLNSNAITYSNLKLIIDSTSIDSIRQVETIIYNLYKEAFNVAVTHNDGPYALWICNKFLSNYHLDNSESSLYQIQEIEVILNQVDILYPHIIKRYGCEEEATLLSQYFTELNILYENNLLLDTALIAKYKQQRDIYLMLFPEKE